MTARRPPNPREQLREFASDIGQFIVDEQRKQRHGHSFPPTVSYKVAAWFLKAVEDYLDGTQPSLDRALGLTQGRGRRKNAKPSGKAYERAKRVFDWRTFDRKSWPEICDLLKVDDPRNVQAELERYQPDIIAEYSTFIMRD
jgi:hypothetical protein